MQQHRAILRHSVNVPNKNTKRGPVVNAIVVIEINTPRIDTWLFVFYTKDRK